MTKELNTPQDRLKHFIYKYYKSVSHFAKIMGISQGALNPYINSDNTYSYGATLDRIKEFGLNPEWYLYGTGEMVIEENIKRNHRFYKPDDDKTVEQKEQNEHKKVNGDELYKLPASFKGILSNIKMHIMSVNAATGTLTSLADMPSSILPLAIGMNIDSDTHQAIYVNGVSMEDAGISNGDVVIFEATSKIPKYDCMIIGSLNGYPIMKYVCHKDGQIILKSDSEKAKDIVLGNLENLELYGIVKKVIKDYAPRQRYN